MDVKRQNMYGGYTNTPPYLNKYYYQYLTVEILENGEFDNFSFRYTDGSKGIMYYSKNDGSWTEFPDSINVSVGDKIRFKQTVDPSKTIMNDYDGLDDSSRMGNIKFNIYGNIMSMLYGDDFIGNNELMGLTWDFSPFAYWFSNCGVCDASNLCLPSTRLCESMYEGMFDGSLLTKAPNIIPAHLSPYCYQSMFSDCKYLTGQITIPQPLSATKDTQAYYEMFFNFSSINVNDPKLELIILALLNKYVSIGDLDGIIYRNYCKCQVVLPWEGIKADPNNSDAFSAELNYFNYEQHGNTEPIGFTKFEMSPDVFGQVLDIQNKNSLFYYFGISDDTFIDQYCTAIEPLQYFLNTPLTFETLDVCEFTWFAEDLHEIKSVDFLEYSINGGAWVKYSKGVIVPSNTIISWRTFQDSTDLTDEWGNNMNLTLITNGVKLTETTTTTCRFNAYGNIMSLISKNFETLNTIPYNNCFKGMFANTQIQSAEKLILPAINLSKACYKEMFKDSTLIISPRILPVKNPRNISSIYESMFYNCYSLQTSPILMLATLFDPPVNGISSGSSEYIGLYETCTNICHSMFYDCTSLSVAPEIHICYLNTTTGQGKHFQYMFWGCSNIKQYKIFTHSSTPGNYHSFMYVGYFENMFVGSDGGGQFFAYDTFSNNTGDLNLFTIASNIGIRSDDEQINMHGDPVIPDEEESQKSVFYINNQGTKYEFEKTYEDMIWDQFLSRSIKLGNTEYPIEFTISNRGYESIAVFNVYSTSGGYGYGSPLDRAGRICNSTSIRDNVLKTDIIQTGKTYYINRFFKESWQ
jgi:hypothetical protein